MPCQTSYRLTQDSVGNIVTACIRARFANIKTTMQALLKWLQYAGIGAAIAAVGWVIVHSPLPQLAMSSALTAGLVFSGYAFRSRGRPEKTAVQRT